MARNASVDWDALDDVIFGCANQAGEDNRNVARMARAARRPAGRRAGRHDQPPVRLGPGRGRHRGARHPGRRGRADDRRRRREHDARAVRDGARPTTRVLAQRRDLRHHDRLALRQPADEEAVRRRFDAGDGRERRRGVPDRRAPTRTRSRCARSRRRWRRRTAGFFASEIVPVDDRAAARASRSWSTQDEHPRGDTTLEALAKLETPFRRPAAR